MANRRTWIIAAVVVGSSLFIAPFAAEQRALPRRTLIELAAFLTLATAVARRRPLPGGWALAGFVVAIAAAATFGEAPGRSWLGPDDGFEGALAWLAYLAVGVLASGTDRRALIAAVTWAAALQATIALGQRLTGTAPTGLFGHVMPLAGYCALGIVTSAGLVATEPRRPEARQRLLALAALALTVAALVLTARRGPAIAALGGLVLVARIASGRQRVAIVATVVVAATVSFAAPASSPAGRWVDAPAARHDTVSQRGDFYRVALDAAGARPALGWGFGAFADHYASNGRARPPVFETRVHALPLELLVAGGAVGLLAFVVLAGAWGRRRDAEPTAWVASAVALTYLAHRMVNVDQPAVGVAAFALAGSAVAGFARTTASNPIAETSAVEGVAGSSPGAAASGPSQPWPRWLVVPLAAMSLAVGARFAADVAMGRALDAGRDRQDIAEWMQAAVALAPYRCLYRLRLAAHLAATQSERRSIVEGCIATEPRRAHGHYHLGLAQMDIGEHDEAVDAFRTAANLVPHHPPFQQALAQALAMSGDPAAALTAIELAIEIAGEDAALHNDRGNVLRMLGRRDAAAGAYGRAVELAPDNPAFRRNAALVTPPAPARD